MVMIEKKHTLPPFLLRQIKQDLNCDFGGKNAKMQKEAWEGWYLTQEVPLWKLNIELLQLQRFP